MNEKVITFNSIRSCFSDLQSPLGESAWEYKHTIRSHVVVVMWWQTYNCLSPFIHSKSSIRFFFILFYCVGLVLTLVQIVCQVHTCSQPMTMHVDRRPWMSLNRSLTSDRKLFSTTDTKQNNKTFFNYL